MCIGGGNTTQSENGPPDWGVGAAKDLLTRGFGFGQDIYNGNRKLETYDPAQAIAPFSDMQNKAFGVGNDIYNRATPGMQTADTGNLALQNQMNGLFQNRAGPANPFAGLFVDPGKNPMLGMDNPFLQNTINSAQNDVVDAYTRGTAAQNDAMFAHSGAFGGSAYQDRTSQNQKGLAKALNDISLGARMQDYGQQQQLQESAINRGVGAQQADLARNSALAQQQIGLGETNFQNSQDRQMQAAGLAPQMANLDFNWTGQLMGLGDRQQSQDQAMRDFTYQNWMLNANPQLRGLDIMSNALQSSIGNAGQFTTPNQGPGPVGTGLGLMALLQGARGLM